jgi:hypothetical protein
MFCPDGVVDIPEACGALLAQLAFNPGSNPGRDAFLAAKNTYVFTSMIKSLVQRTHKPGRLKVKSEGC